ncbi:hypothetical protein WA026_009651 [Henosepilachna vigintioctopunctata]|uniref:Uncharacterized protein n=1 Tax=Henosepilachna vigintioctopunctata TaxID=420089 RepID=A0AAW1U954_9CUCU
MKVLFICIALALECYSTVETTNATTTSTLETPEFESSKIVHTVQATKSIVYNATTESTPTNSSDKTTTWKKKPFIRLRKVKKNFRGNLYTNNVYKVHENEKENSESNRKFTDNSHYSGENRLRLNLSDINYKKMKMPYEKPSSNDFQRDESRIISSYRFPENSEEVLNDNPLNIEISRGTNIYKVQEDPFENMETKELSFDNREPANPFRYEFESQSVPKYESSKISYEQPVGPRPSLPEINNVIQNLNTQENTQYYRAPKENHVVEVNKVPLVFEHHYQGDYKHPQMKFVAHQYSYSPPTDNSDEAFQLGQILSQNAVQKLQSAKQPLEEFVENKQEVTLNIPVRSMSSFSHQNYEKVPRGRYSGPQYQHPLIKHLVPEMSHNDFNRATTNFQISPNSNAYQILIPKSQLHPIVVEDEPIKPVYETTYLSAIPEQPIEYNHQPDVTQQYRTNSPYSVNVQQDFMDVPQYTLMSFFNLQDRIKPEAIHEVEPPNLARFNNFRNINIMKNAPSAVRHGDFMRNTEYRSKSPVEQHRPVENPTSFRGEDPRISKWRSGIEMLKQQLAKLIKPNPTATSSLVPFTQHPKTQMIQSRPYWRKPQIMKLVRIPEQHHSPQQEYQPQHQKGNIQDFNSYVNIGDNSQVSHNIKDQHHSPGHSQSQESNTVSENQDISDHYSGNVNHAAQERPPLESNVQQHFTSVNLPIDQEKYIFAKEPSQDPPKNIYYTQEVVEENPIQYMEMKNNNYHNSMNYKKQPNDQTEVQIVKSVSPNFNENSNYETVQYNSDYTNPRIVDETSSVELPKGYLNYQDPRSIWRTRTTNKNINTRPTLQIQKPQFRDMNGNLRSNSINPYSILRRVASDPSGQNHKRRNISYLVLMREHDDR